MYMAKPKADNVAIIADKLPKNPSHGFERTTSPIIHVIILKEPINTNVEVKYGTTVLVFRSNS